MWKIDFVWQGVHLRSHHHVTFRERKDSVTIFHVFTLHHFFEYPRLQSENAP
jgi:hypothetical protein